MDNNIFLNYREWLAEQKIPKGKRSVLLAGLDLFSQYGFNGTSTAQIATKAGTSQATIFKYFKTKEDLLLAIIQPIIKNLLPIYQKDFLNSLNKFTTVKDLIHFFIRDRYHFVSVNMDAFIIIFSEFLTNKKVRDLFMQLITASAPKISGAAFMQNPLKKQIRPELDSLPIIRTILGQMIIYLLQQKYAPKITTDLNHDLNLIEEQITRAISIN